jgi:hypothetical protein
MPKVTIITDQSGSIVGTFQVGKPSKDAPTHARIRAREGQCVHDLEVPDALANPSSIHKLHSTHRVETRGGSAKLVENSG